MSADLLTTMKALGFTLGARYAWNAANPTASITRLATSTGDRVRALYYDALEQVGASSDWIDSGAAGQAEGTLTQSGAVLTLHGQTRKLDFVPPPGLNVSFRALGVDLSNSGSNTGQEARIALIVAAGIAGNWTIVDAGQLMTTANPGVDLSYGTHDLKQMRIKESGTGTTTAGPQASPKVLATVSGASLGTVRDSAIWVEGINQIPNQNAGQDSFQGNLSTRIGVRISNDGNSNSRRRINANRCYVGAEAYENTEKQEADIVGVGNQILFREVDDGVGSPDSNIWHLRGTENYQIFVSGNSTSSVIHFDHEQRIDPGAGVNDITLSDGTSFPLPAIHVPTGKLQHFSEDCESRGHNGRVFTLFDKPYVDGADTVIYHPRHLHHYGVGLWVEFLQRLAGRPYFNDFDNGRSRYGYTGTPDWPCPVVQINQLESADGFFPSGSKIRNREFYRIGDADRDRYPTNLDLVLSGSMYDTDPFGNESGPNSRTGFYPRNKCLFAGERMEGGSVHFTVAHGYLQLLDGFQGVSISLPASFIDNGYDIDDDSGASYHCAIRGRTKFSHVGVKPWLATSADKTIGLEATEEYGAAGYDGANWTVARPLSAEDEAFTSISHVINTDLKVDGVRVRRNSDNALLQAVGNGPNSPWVNAAGVEQYPTVSIVEQAATTAFVARMAGAPASPLHRTLDRVFYGLDVKNLANKVVGLHLPGIFANGTDALLNLAASANRTVALASTYDLVAVNTPIWLAETGLTYGEVGALIINSGFNANDGETVTINGKVYTFQDTLTNVDGHVKIGATGPDTVTNLAHAVNASGGTSGTDYAAATVAHTTRTATASGTMCLLPPIVPGTALTLIKTGLKLSTTLGTGYYSSPWSALSAAEGVAQNSLHSWQAVIETTSNGSFDISAANNKLGSCANASTPKFCAGAASNTTLDAAFAAPKIFTGVRTASGQQLGYLDDQLVKTGSVASTGLPNAMYVLRSGSGDNPYCDRPQPGFGWGAGLDATDVANLVEIVSAALRAGNSI